MLTRLLTPALSSLGEEREKSFAWFGWFAVQSSGLPLSSDFHVVNQPINAVSLSKTHNFKPF